MSRIAAPLVAIALLGGPASFVAVAQTPAHNHSNAVGPLHLEGQPAPRIEGRVHIGARVPSLDDLKGKVVLLFFWAHWCVECRAESPTMAKLVAKYRSEGLTIVAPTQRYGYVEGGRPAPPDRELRHIIQVRDSHYSFLRDAPVPLGEANHKAYGVEAIPVHVLIDRQGIVRHYHAGRMSEEDLEAEIRKLL